MSRMPINRIQNHITHTLQGIDKGEVGEDFVGGIPFMGGMTEESYRNKEVAARLRKARLQRYAQMAAAPAPMPEEAPRLRRPESVPVPGETPAAYPGVRQDVPPELLGDVPLPGEEIAPAPGTLPGDPNYSEQWYGDTIGFDLPPAPYKPGLEGPVVRQGALEDWAEKELDNIEFMVYAEAYPAIKNSIDEPKEDPIDGFGKDRNERGLEDTDESIDRKDGVAATA